MHAVNPVYIVFSSMFGSLEDRFARILFVYVLMRNAVIVRDFTESSLANQTVVVATTNNQHKTNAVQFLLLQKKNGTKLLETAKKWNKIVRNIALFQN